MNSRERVIKTIDFDSPDRVPIDHFWLPGAMMKHDEKLRRIRSKYPSDFAFPAFWDIGWAEAEGYYGTLEEEQDRIGKKEGLASSELWGWTSERATVGVAGQPTRNPLADWKDWEDYEFPPAITDDFIEKVNFVNKYLHLSGHDKYVISHSGSLFHTMCHLRGFTRALVDLVSGRKEILNLRDRIVDYTIEKTKRWVELDVDGVHFADDWGSQTHLFIRPKMWRDLFKPAYKKMIAPIKAAGKDCWFHTDGVTEDIWIDLKDCGVDVINPQLSCMDIDELARKFGGKICVQSDLDRQYTMPSGTTEEVTEHVKHVIKAFGDYNGGLIGHGEIGPDVPMKNVEAMFAAFKKYGEYPLKL